MGDDGSSLWGGGLAEHHELDPLGDAVEESDETLQDGIVHRAAMHHKAVVVLKLKRGKGHHLKCKCKDGVCSEVFKKYRYVKLRNRVRICWSGSCFVSPEYVCFLFNHVWVIMSYRPSPVSPSACALFLSKRPQLPHLSNDLMCVVLSLPLVPFWYCIFSFLPEC